GCDASETLSPPQVGGDIEPNDRRTVKQRLGSRVALIGGIDQGDLLTHGSPAQIEDHVRACFESFGEQGGYICCPSDRFFETPVQNLRELAEAAKTCRY
ncbi:MAG: uroporphyrinogen decarboxylase family protein, partial [Phycisphaeraceae bacterium]|nr:uroporphyrinogen decarboxylase family protein [Phycisphaeraceae bacterium]